MNMKYRTESPLAKEVNLVNAVTFFKDGVLIGLDLWYGYIHSYL